MRRRTRSDFLSSFLPSVLASLGLVLSAAGGVMLLPSGLTAQEDAFFCGSCTGTCTGVYPCNGSCGSYLCSYCDCGITGKGRCACL